MNSGSDSSFFIFVTPPNTPKTSRNTVSNPKTSHFISTTTPKTPLKNNFFKTNNQTQIQELEEKLLLTPLTPSNSTTVISKTKKETETFFFNITQKASTIQQTTLPTQKSSLSIQQTLTEQSTIKAQQMSVFSVNTPSILERRKIKKLYIGGETTSKESTILHHHLKYTLFNTNNTADFPVVVLPGLYLGDKATSGDYECLKKHQIRHVVNVTPDLENVFEGCSDIRYLRVPIDDHSWNQQNVQHYLNRAVSFIDECRQKKQSVLVHCMVGMNRSVVVTVAYLMHHLKLPLDEAFDKLGALRASINPNLSLMHQLYMFANFCSCEGTSRAGRNNITDVSVGDGNDDFGGSDSGKMKRGGSLIFKNNVDVSNENNKVIVNSSKLFGEINLTSKDYDNKLNNNNNTGISNNNQGNNGKGDINTRCKSKLKEMNDDDNTDPHLKEASSNDFLFLDISLLSPPPPSSS